MTNSAILMLVALVPVSGVQHMNPFPYLIANPLSPSAGTRSYRGEFFEVYGPNITNRYSEVSWDPQPVQLPPSIVQRFDGRVMAVTGMEVDIVRTASDGAEERVPCTEQYNHHFSGYMHGKAARRIEGESNAPKVHGRALPQWHVNVPTGSFPSIQVFSEGNGNEHRRTFKGYAIGTAQLILSPEQWENIPMIINGNKRLTDDRSPGPVASLQPRKSTVPPNGPYNGLFECPCTSRKPKLLDSYRAIPEALGSQASACTPAAIVETAAECVWGAPRAGLPAFSTHDPLIVNDTALPVGCFATTDTTGAQRLMFNNYSLPTSPYLSAPLHLHVPGGETSAGSDARVHVCRDVDVNAGTIDGSRFNPGVCAPAPKSELIDTHNAICNISAYGGGLLCCSGGSFLLDGEQIVPAQTDTWRLKYRFYFEEYAAQRNLFRAWWSTEAVNNEYALPTVGAGRVGQDVS
jgi:hypothetical protein